MCDVMRGAWCVRRPLAVLACWMLGVLALAGQGKELQRANRLDCSLTPKTNWVAFSNEASLVFSVTMDNFSGSDIYLFIRDVTTNSFNGATGSVSFVKIPTGTTGSMDWGPAGAPFQSMNVAASQTPFTLTNFTANVGIITVTRRRDP